MIPYTSQLDSKYPSNLVFETPRCIENHFILFFIPFHDYTQATICFYWLLLGNISRTSPLCVLHSKSQVIILSPILVADSTGNEKLYPRTSPFRTTFERKNLGKTYITHKKETYVKALRSYLKIRYVVKKQQCFTSTQNWFVLNQQNNIMKEYCFIDIIFIKNDT